jgi:hypothetical protein
MDWRRTSATGGNYQQLRMICVKFALVPYNRPTTQYSLAVLVVCFLVSLPAPSAIFAQTVSPAQPLKPGTDGVYEFDASDLNKLDSSPKVEFPREASSYEIADKVVIALTISPAWAAEKPKVFITSNISWLSRGADGEQKVSGGGNADTVEVIKLFRERCSVVAVNIRLDKAGHIVLAKDDGSGPLGLQRNGLGNPRPSRRKAAN